MYLIVLVVISLFAQKHSCEKTEAYREFASLYMTKFKTGLANLEKMTVSDTKAQFKSSNLFGEFLLNRGFVGLDLNLELLDVTDKPLSPLPPGAKQGVEVHNLYKLPKIEIHYKYKADIALIKPISGSLIIAVSNLTVDVKLTAYEDNVTCNFGDRGPSVDFGRDDYQVEFQLDEAGPFKVETEGVVQIVINTYIRTYLHTFVNDAVNSKIPEIRGTSLSKAGQEFYDRMKEALCSF